MVAFESNLLIFLAVAGVLGLTGYGVYALRDPLFSRAVRYFKTWWERDKRAEEEARRNKEARKRAEQELKDNCAGNGVTVSRQVTYDNAAGTLSEYSSPTPVPFVATSAGDCVEAVVEVVEVGQDRSGRCG